MHLGTYELGKNDRWFVTDEMESRNPKAMKAKPKKFQKNEDEEQEYKEFYKEDKPASVNYARVRKVSSNIS